MKLTKRHWYATDLVAASFGIFLGMVMPRPSDVSNTGRHAWIVRIYTYEAQHTVLLAAIALVPLTLFAFKKRPIGLDGWIVSFFIGFCVGMILYSPASPL